MSAEGPREVWSGEDDEVLADLMAKAGPREPISGDLLRLRGAVEEHWRAAQESKPEPARRAASRQWWVAAAAVLAIAFGFLLRQNSGEADLPIATVWKSSGSVEIIGGEDGLRPGTQIATGLGGRVALRLDGSRSLRLDEASRLRFSEGRRVELLAGAVYSDSGFPGDPSEAVILSTPFGEIHELGTQYEVRLDSELLRVRVREGRVALSRQEDHPTGRLQVDAGEEVVLGSEGSVQRSALEANDESWSWTTAAAPALEIEGASVERLLTWTAREGGWGLRFADASAAQEAKEIILHGSIEGLTLLEGLALALEGSGLEAQVVGSELVARRLKTPR